MNETLQKTLTGFFESLDELLAHQDIKQIRMKGMPNHQPGEPSATYTKEQVMGFWRLSILFNEQWKQSAKLQPQTTDGKARSWRKPSTIAPKPKSVSTGEGRKPWTNEEKARMALVRKMRPGDRDLNMVVERLYPGKNYDWFLTHYAELQSVKNKG